VVVDSGEFNWSNGRFPVIVNPSPAYHGLQFHETFGTYGYLMKLRAETLRDLGAAMSPFNAFLFLQGLETLSLRMARHVENAKAIAIISPRTSWCRVTYRDCPRAVTARWLGICRAAPARSSFDCRGGRAADRTYSRCHLVVAPCERRDSKSLIIHPASTTHRQLNDDELRAAGVGPGTIRLSVGTEAVEDLIWDLEQGFARASAAASTEVGTV
jgi:O-acetylhomoserine (thiol)-lyase